MDPFTPQQHQHHGQQQNPEPDMSQQQQQYHYMPSGPDMFQQTSHSQDQHFIIPTPHTHAHTQQRRASVISEHHHLDNLYQDQPSDQMHSSMPSSGTSHIMSSSKPAPTQRKQSISKSTPKLYALRIASQPGIYRSWVMAKTLIEGCPGAKYKGFVTVEECMQFIWMGFPNSTFTVNEAGDYIMDDPEPVFQVIEEARQKKEKNSGILLDDDMSAYEPSESNANRIASLFQSDPNVQIPLNAEQQTALDLVKAGQNVFISGARKTGKDLVLSHIYNHLVSEKKSFHITSASVITAQNTSSTYTLGWTGMGKALGTKKQILSKVRKNTQARKAWSDISCLVIKDCSMLPAFLLDVIDFLAREIRKNPDTPFGGMQIVLVGYTHGPLPQPSQAVCCPHCGQTHRVGTGFGALGSQVGQFITCSNEECKHMFINSWILYPFEAAVWDESKFHYAHLTNAFGEDERLGNLLTEFSKEPPFSEQALEALKVLAEKPKETVHQVTAICANNDEMNKMNDNALLQIPGDIVKYEAIDTALNNFDFSSRAQQKDGPTDEFLNLKLNTHVLVIAENGRDVETGVVVDFVALTPAQITSFSMQSSHGMPQVQSGVKEWLQKNPLLPKVKFDGRDEPMIVNCRVWIIRSNGRAAAWRIQLPVRPAYALSLAKGQDLMISNIMISASREWLSGEMYMALSLAKSFDSIHLDGLTEASFTADTRVLEFMKSASHGSASTSVKSNNVPEGFFVAPPNVSSLKRHSVAAMGGGGSQKKRRPSKVASVMPSFMEESGGVDMSGRNVQIADPQLLRYQQMSQRRHSYQPLSSYQEQQQHFAFLQASHSGMMAPQMLQQRGAAPSGLRNMLPMGMSEFQMGGNGGPGSAKQYHRGSISYEGLPSLSAQQSHQQKPYSMQSAQASPYENGPGLPMMMQDLGSPNDMMHMNMGPPSSYDGQHQQTEWQWQP